MSCGLSSKSYQSPDPPLPPLDNVICVCSLNNCCCGGPNDCSDINERCGTNPRVVKLTGSDADILCGEWETGDTPPTASGEKYNIVLNIKEIIRHPDFTVNLNGSIYIQNDIAVFKVDDTILSKVSQISKHLFKMV